MIPFILSCKRLYDKFVRDEITVYAAQASFFIVIAAFPFMMLLLTVVQVVPAINKTDVLSILIAMMPDVLDPLVIYVMDDLYTESPGTVLSITAITALWSASRGMLSIERGLNRVFDSQEKRNYVVDRLICAGYTLVFIFVCIISLLLLVFGTSLQNFLNRVFPVVAAFTTYIISLRTLLSLAVLTASFALLYTYVPKKKQKIKQQLPGAVFSTICWIGFSFVFSLYFRNIHRFSYMYGSLTAMVLLMLWLYICICILFLGAEINIHRLNMK